MTLRKYKAVLFDLDGVLVNMPGGHYEALNRALALFGVTIDRDEHFSLFNGLPTRVKIELLEKQNRLPGGLKEFIHAMKQKYTKELIPRYCTPDYSKIILLNYLKERDYKLACCSNSIREALHYMLESAHLKSFFDCIVGNDEVVNSKPHPEIYLRAIEVLGVKPHECIIIEDAPYGVAAAKASGASVLQVSGVEDVNLALLENMID